MKTILPSQFSKDHWSLLAYIECRCVDDRGALDKRHLRCHPTRHGLHAVNSRLIPLDWQPTYGTSLKDGTRLPSHDDWDVVHDLEAAGYVALISAANGFVSLTKMGQSVVALLRAHKASGGQFADFHPEALAV